MSKTPVEFYFDFISPYGYLGSTQIDAIAARYGREVDWKPVLIGVTIMRIMGIKPLTETPLKQDYLRHDGPRMAKIFGVPYRPHGHKGMNSVAASRAFLWLKARDPALAKQFAREVYAKVWTEGVNIQPPESVADIAAPLGIDRAALLQAMSSDEMREALKTAVDEAVAKGVFGVPYFIVDNEPFWGGDRLWMLEHWLKYGDWSSAKAAQQVSFRD